MNGFANHGLDESAFDEKGTTGGLKTFDAFRKLRILFVLFVCSANRRRDFCVSNGNQLT